MNTEWLILADHADIVGNKLYLNGGGWDVLTINSGFPASRSFAVAAAFAVPWGETNVRHSIEIEVRSGDGVALAGAKGQFEVGRPPGIPPGQTQRTQIAVNFTLAFQAGTYEVVSRIQGADDKQISFNVVSGPMLLAKQQQEGAA